MKFKLDPDNISSAALSVPFDKIKSITKAKKGKVPVPEMLSILNFPIEVQTKIKNARGPLEVTCSGNQCTAKNTGKVVEEDIPGAGGALGIIIDKKFSCEFKLGSLGRSLVIDNIKGLTADGPAFINPDVDKITIILPRHVELEL